MVECSMESFIHNAKTADVNLSAFVRNADK